MVVGSRDGGGRLVMVAGGQDGGGRQLIMVVGSRDFGQGQTIRCRMGVPPLTQ